MDTNTFIGFSNAQKSIIKKWKVVVITRTLSRSGCPSKLDRRVRRKLVRQATKRFIAALKQ